MIMWNRQFINTNTKIYDELIYNGLINNEINDTIEHINRCTNIFDLMQIKISNEKNIIHWSL